MIAAQTLPHSCTYLPTFYLNICCRHTNMHYFQSFGIDCDWICCLLRCHTVISLGHGKNKSVMEVRPDKIPPVPPCVCTCMQARTCAPHNSSLSWLLATPGQMVCIQENVYSIRFLFTVSVELLASGMCYCMLSLVCTNGSDETCRFHL
jgi:hypothetical protein